MNSFKVSAVNAGIARFYGVLALLSSSRGLNWLPFSDKRSHAAKLTSDGRMIKGSPDPLVNPPYSR